MPEKQPGDQPENEGLYAWRFASADGTTIFQKTPQTVGRRYKLPYRADEERADGGSPKSGRRIRAGMYGFHGSVDPLDALDYGDGFFVERVLLEGHKDIEPDKIAASLRTTLWRADAKQTVHLFAASCVERALYKCNASSDEMAKCWVAVEALRKFATGDVSEEEMRACVNRMQTPNCRQRSLGETNPLKLAARAACYAALSFNTFGDSANACWDAAEAVVYAGGEGQPDAEADEAWRAERLWQSRSLDLRLLRLVVLPPNQVPNEAPNAEGIAA